MNCDPSVEDAKLFGVRDMVCIKEIIMSSRLGCPKGRLITWEQLQGIQYTIVTVVATALALLIGIIVMIFLLLKRSYVPLPDKD